MLSCEVSVESQLSLIAGEKYLQARMWNFMCFDALWEVFSERCLEKTQHHLSLILFWDDQNVWGNEQTVFKDRPSLVSSQLFLPLVTQKMFSSALSSLTSPHFFLFISSFAPPLQLFILFLKSFYFPL